MNCTISQPDSECLTVRSTPITTTFPTITEYVPWKPGLEK
jgi:hypothetical protein